MAQLLLFFFETKSKGGPNRTDLRSLVVPCITGKWHSGLQTNHNPRRCYMSKLRSMLAVLSAAWLLVPVGRSWADDTATTAKANDEATALQFFEKEATV